MCGLYVPAMSIYLDTIRDTYESLVIYAFYMLLIHSLGGYEKVKLATPIQWKTFYVFQ